MGARPCSRFSRIAGHVIPGPARAGSSGPAISGVVIRSFQLAAALARRRSVRGAAVVLLVAGALSGSLPLVEAPGYELGQAGALIAALLAAFAGIAAARVELGREAPSPSAAWSAATAIVAALVAALLLGAVVRAALGPCSALGPAAWFLVLLPLPSAMLGAAVAVAAGFLARGGRARAGVLYAIVALGSLAWSLRGAYLGPAATDLRRGARPGSPRRAAPARRGRGGDRGGGGRRGVRARGTRPATRGRRGGARGGGGGGGGGGGVDRRGGRARPAEPVRQPRRRRAGARRPARRGAVHARVPGREAERGRRGAPR